MLGCPFPVLWLEKVGFVWTFLCLYLIFFPGYQVFLTWNYKKDLPKDTRGRKFKELTCHRVISWIPKFLIRVSVSPPFRSVLFVTPRFLLVLRRKNRKKNLVHCIIHRSGSLTTKFQETTSCMCVKVLQSCTTLCNPMDCSLPGSSVHQILQARILEWAAISSSRGSSQPRAQTHISYVSGIGRQVLYQLCHLGSILSNKNIHNYV